MKREEVWSMSCNEGREDIQIKSNRCSKCGSTKIVPQVSVIDQGQASGGKLLAYVNSKPKALLLKGAVYTELVARICGDCGYSELYATNAKQIYQTYRMAENSG